MKDRELIALAEKAEARVLGWIEEGLLSRDPAFGVCDILVLLKDRVVQAEKADRVRLHVKEQRAALGPDQPISLEDLGPKKTDDESRS